MSQITRRTRVRLLAESVLAGRAVGGYANLIEARLRKLAAEGSTGMLPLSGRGDGAIFFSGGRVVYAESTRTPMPFRREAGLAALGLALGDAGASSAGQEPAAVPSLDRLTGLLALAEPTIDAITDLVSSESRYAKFRQSEVPAAAQTSALSIESSLSLESVLAEVERRRQMLRQLAPAVTADTAVIRHAPRDSPRFQVSAPQWSLLVRAGAADGTTPRTLAMALGRSVFGTTLEVYRLLALGLLAVPGHPPHPPHLAIGPAGRRPAEVMSFLRALAEAGGSDA